MSDFFEPLEFGSQDSNNSVRHPPFFLTGVGVALVVTALVMFAIDSQIGYGLSVLAMVSNSIATFVDQRSRADFNYVTIDWYRPFTVFLRLLTLLVAFGHILLLAIESAR